MNILLLGEYSRLHLTLSESLKKKGHNVIVASDGDGYKKYDRDIDLSRKEGGIVQKIKDIYTISKKIHSLKHFDIVQLINPCFTTLNTKINKHFFDFLFRNNKKIFLGAFGVDSVWIKAALDKNKFRYSEFHIGDNDNEIPFNNELKQKWINTSRENLNHYIAQKAKGIIACLYEYHIAYQEHYLDKLKYIPLPINVKNINYTPIESIPKRIKFFIGIDPYRSQFKGTDILLKMLHKLKEKYPNDIELKIAESVPYQEYKILLEDSHVVLDQIYSYSPSVNPLQAMAQGKIVVSGGETEIYDLLDPDSNNRPIINTPPTEEGVFQTLEHILANKHKFPEWSHESRMFVEKYHDSDNIAEQYLRFWEK